MRIAIVDDISEERTLLHNRLESQFFQAQCPYRYILNMKNGETFSHFSEGMSFHCSVFWIFI